MHNLKRALTRGTHDSLTKLRVKPHIQVPILVLVLVSVDGQVEVHVEAHVYGRVDVEI